MKTPEFHALIVLIFLISALLCLPAGAQNETTYYQPITDLALNIKELTLNVGDRYTLPLSYQPAETPASFLKWYTDESMIRIDPETFTITALAPGQTRILVESRGGFAWDQCDITVNGTGFQSFYGEEVQILSEADRNKIRAESVLRYLDYIENAGLSREERDKQAERRFSVTAIAAPGTAAAQSRLAASLGMEKALELPDFNAVSMYGTLDQILAYVENNEDLESLIEFAPMISEDPLPEDEPELSPKDLNLQDTVDELSSISKAHGLGLKGDGTVIAIVDTGLNKDHEQFAGRVIAEYCASWSDDSDGIKNLASCEKGSSEPSRAKMKAEYNHGSHAAGIAAGRDGIAPHAKIVSINNSGEACDENNTCIRLILFNIMEVTQYLVDLQKSFQAEGKPQIVAVNMSFGNSKKYSDYCDADYPVYKKAFDLLLQNDMIPVVSSGNNGFVDQTGPYGCLTNSFAVGRLAADPNPTIFASSSHSKMVDILAPGTKIWSALYADDGKEETTCSGINCYGYKSGTSMAAPVVTGAFAILKQADPSLTAGQLKDLIISMSTKTANHRLAVRDIPAHTFLYDKPVLDFSEIEKYIKKPEPRPLPDLWPVDMTVLPRTGFSAVRPQPLPAMPKDLNYRPLKMLLEIPSLDVTSDLVTVPFRDNEYAVSLLGDATGLLEGSSLPGEGRTILAAHNHLNTTESGPFALLRFMKEGDRIFVRSRGNELLTYAVYANEKVAETDLEAASRIAAASDNSLILITCEDETVSGGYANRRIVAAKRIP